mgnify:CR=1 FL=1
MNNEAVIALLKAVKDNAADTAANTLLGWDGTEGVRRQAGLVWDVGALTWVKEQQAVLRTDNVTVTLPATAATAAAQDVGNGSLTAVKESLAPAGNVRHSVVAIGPTAVAVPATALPARKRLYIHNPGPLVVYLGDSTVTVATGFPISQGQSLHELAGAAAMYAISTGTVAIRVLEIA